MHTGLFLGLLAVPLLVFAGSLSATLTVLGVSHFAFATSADRLVLAGVAVSFIVMSAANVLMFLGDPKADHNGCVLGVGRPWFGTVGQVDLSRRRSDRLWDLSVAEISNPKRHDVGGWNSQDTRHSCRRFRLTLFVIGALITGITVAFSGIIGFVGLMVPHIVRLVVGGDFRRLLPVLAFCGAALLVWADIITHTIMAPDDMPIGIVTSSIGGLFFVWLLRNPRRVRPGTFIAFAVTLVPWSLRRETCRD